MIYTVTLNPALDKTVVIPHFRADTVNRVTNVRMDPGGKGINVSKVLAELGEPSVAFGFAGGAAGQTLRRMLAERGLESELYEADGETRTNLKIIDPASHTNTDINEPGPQVSATALEELLRRLLARIAPGDLVVLSGSLPSGAPADTYRRWTERCRQAGARVFLDADGEALARGLQAGPYLIKPNRDELSRLVGRPLSSCADIAEAAQGLFAYGVRKIVVSLGGEGALYLTQGKMWQAQAVPVPVGSTVGAGDSMLAALALAAQRQMDLDQSIRLSMATGAANVMTSGTQPANYAAIAPLLQKVSYKAYTL